MSVVNLAEVASHYAKLGAARQDIEALLRPLPIRLMLLDAALSYDAGMLRPVTLEGGLSLGDRCCLALAKREVPACPHRGAALAPYRRGGGGHGRADPMRARRTTKEQACRRSTVAKRLRSATDFCDRLAPRYHLDTRTGRKSQKICDRGADATFGSRARGPAGVDPLQTLAALPTLPQLSRKEWLIGNGNGCPKPAQAGFLGNSGPFTQQRSFAFAPVEHRGRVAARTCGHIPV